MPATILVIDDDTTVLLSLKLLLGRAGYAVQTVTRMTEALPAVTKHHPALALLDMNFSISTTGRDGMQVLRDVLTAYPNLPVIQMTGWATVQLAVEGMKAGARDFIAKPWDNKELLNTIATELAKNDQPYKEVGEVAGVEKQRKEQSKVATDPFASIVGNSKALTNVLDQARRVAATQASVLITGESGTGKELIAEALHAASPRAKGPFVAVNLGGVPAGLFESELFGHKAGAFTDARTDRKGRFELAEGGTLFLDEIGDLDPAGQVKLLRVLQERQYERLGESRTRRTDVRIVSATSRDLPAMVRAGTFREDLLYRINLIHLHLPPLRERPVDIELLSQYFLKRFSQNYNRPDLQLSTESLDWLRGQHFAGNVRQLQNLIERVTILAPSDTIGVADLEQQQQSSQAATDTSLQLAGTTLEEMEIRMVRGALDRNEGEVAATARELGLTRAALYRRLEKFGIER